ncbi:MAG: hypothetical protein CM15mP14_3400 [Rhodospirillaceae bacterium]|nr:MAG: hypothetical protein CM15mP14_3400 [Rhodospirillaceae bacterium]
MPDTYFENYKIINLWEKKISSPNFDVVLGKWKIKQNPIGKTRTMKRIESVKKKNRKKDENSKKGYFLGGFLKWETNFKNFFK